MFSNVKERARRTSLALNVSFAEAPKQMEAAETAAAMGAGGGEDRGFAGEGEGVSGTTTLLSSFLYLFVHQKYRRGSADMLQPSV